jgi:serine/threonine protein kinase
MSATDQIIEICRIMGTPTKEQLTFLYGANNNTNDMKMPQFPPRPWASVLSNASIECIDLLRSLLDYVPASRTSCIDACAHMYFDQLRYPEATFPDGSRVPKEMHTFTNEELSLASVETADLFAQQSVPSTMRLH